MRRRRHRTWFLGLVPGLGRQEGEMPLDGPPFSIDGNDITGSITIEQSWPEGADRTAAVSFDVSFPDAVPDC